MQLEKLNQSLSFKLGLSLVSVVFTLALVEGALRLAGYTYRQSHNKSYLTPYAENSQMDRDSTYEKYLFEGKEGRHSILCIGDSFTNAGNVESYHSYPYHLYKLFEKNQSPKNVLNMGMCENSTFGVWDRLKNYLTNPSNTDIPAAVVILVGSADNFERSQMGVETDKNNNPWVENIPKGWLYDLRLYKLYRHFKLAMTYRFITKGVEKERSMEDDVAVLLDIHQKLKKALIGTVPGHKMEKKLAPLFVQQTKRLSRRFKKYAIDLKIHIDSPQDLMQAALIYVVKNYTTHLRHDEGLGLLLEMAKDLPQYFWTKRFEESYFYTLQIYQIQSRYTAENILEVLNQNKRDYQNATQFEYFNEFYELISNWEEVSRRVDENRLKAWEKIVQLCREKDIQLLIMNYPSDYQSANRMIKNISEKYNIPMIDNHKRFSELIQKEGRGKYLDDDDHFTPLGYELMAGEVYQKLSQLLREVK